MKKYKIFIFILAALFFGSGALAQEYDLASEALYSFGRAFLKQERYAEAKQELNKCLMLNPRHKKAKELLRLCEEQIELKKNKAIEVAYENVKTGRQESKTEVAPPIQKGAWTLKKGETYAELYTKYYWHNHRFDDNGKKKRWDYDGKGNEIRTELKLERGFSDRLTLMLYTVAKEAHWKDSFKSCTSRGFTEIWPGLKYRLFEKPFICSLQARTKIPFDYSEEAVPALGTHQIDADFKILTAQPYPKLPGYTKFELGFRGRNEEPANEIPYFFEIGYNPTSIIVLKATLDGNEGLASTGGVDEDWIKYSAGPIFKIKDFFNIEFGFGHTFVGKNTSAAKEVYLTLSSQW